MPEVTLRLTHDSLMELLHGLTDSDLQYLADRLADKLQRPTQETYTIAEISEKLKLSPETISDRIHKGEFGDVIRDGRRYRVTAAGCGRKKQWKEVTHDARPAHLLLYRPCRIGCRVCVGYPVRRSPEGQAMEALIVVLAWSAAWLAVAAAYCGICEYIEDKEDSKNEQNND